MPRQHLLPYGDFDAAAMLSAVKALDQKALDAVEVRYEEKLNARVRTLIRLAMIPFSANIQVESSAASKASIKKIKKLLDLTRSLRRDFPRGPSDPSIRANREMAEYAMHSNEQWKSIGLPYLLEHFSEVLQDNEMLARGILARASDGPEFIKGQAWQIWVFTLRQILKEAKLPIEVRKDGLGDSRFVKFIDEIQKQLPHNIQSLVRKRSLEALAKAIDRTALEFSDWTDVPVEKYIKLQNGIMKPLFRQGEVLFEIDVERAKRFDDLLLRASSSSS